MSHPRNSKLFLSSCIFWIAFVCTSTSFMSSYVGSEGIVPGVVSDDVPWHRRWLVRTHPLVALVPLLVTRRSRSRSRSSGKNWTHGECQTHARSSSLYPALARMKVEPASGPSVKKRRHQQRHVSKPPRFSTADFIPTISISLYSITSVNPQSRPTLAGQMRMRLLRGKGKGAAFCVRMAARAFLELSGTGAAFRYGAQWRTLKLTVFET